MRIRFVDTLVRLVSLSIFIGPLSAQDLGPEFKSLCDPLPSTVNFRTGFRSPSRRLPNSSGKRPIVSASGTIEPKIGETVRVSG